MTNQVDTLKLAQEQAKQGIPEAIRFLINSNLKSRCITVDVKLKNSHLVVIARSNQTIQQQGLVDLTHKFVVSLKSKKINTVEIFAVRQGEKVADWNRKVEPILQLKNFIACGYFPKELIPSLTTKNTVNCLDTVVDALEISPQSNSKYCSFSFPKVKHLRRNLGIPNPLHQIKLCKVLADKWNVIAKFIHSSSLSISVPSLTFNKHYKRAFPLADAKIPVERVTQSVGSRYQLYADISRFYSTIYTHSIPWAIHTKSIAKKNRGHTLYGNDIDKCIRNTQDGQTVGIPIGPDSSLVISEIIGTAIDNILCEDLGEKLKGFRYVDDYYLYFDSRSQAEHALSILHKTLKEFELETNPTKTSIIELPEDLEQIWISELRLYSINSDTKDQQAEIITFFSKAFEFSKLFPDDNVIKYALSKTKSTTIHVDNWLLYESLILQSIIAEPSVLPVAVEILLGYSIKDYPLNKLNIENTVTSVISYHSDLNHSYELSWALWLSKTFEIRISDAAAIKISLSQDSIIALAALNLYHEGLIPSGLDLTRWESLMTREELYSDNWLLAYEANVKGWLPSKDCKNYVDEDPFFSILKNNSVHFYDPREQVVSLEVGAETSDDGFNYQR